MTCRSRRFATVMLLAAVTTDCADETLAPRAKPAPSEVTSSRRVTGSVVQQVAFTPAISFSVEAGPGHVAIGDLNGDGNPDIAVALARPNSVAILLGASDGLFGPPAYFTVGSIPSLGTAHSVTIGDLNGDGKLDLAVSLYSPDDIVAVLFGTGTGSFGPATNYSVGYVWSPAALGDLNGDGIADLAVALTMNNQVAVLIGTGAGVFGTPTKFAAGNYPKSPKIGDFNGDGIPDIVIANEMGNSISVLLGTGNGILGAATDYPSGPATNDVVSGDFNRDGILDLAAANRDGKSVTVFLGTGTGSFTACTVFPVGYSPTSVVSSDFNGDGLLDLATANINGSTVSILLGSGDGSFSAQSDLAVGLNPYNAAIGDLNGDGKPDLVTANASSDDISVLLNGIAVSHKAEQIINFGALATQTYGDSPFATSATAFSGLPVSFASIGNCTVSGTTVTLAGAGNCTVTASQAGDANYNAAPSVTQSFAIAKAMPIIAWNAPASMVYGEALGGAQLNATATGVGSVSLSGAVTYSPAAGTVLNVGSQTLVANFTPDDVSNYTNAANSVSIAVLYSTVLGHAFLQPINPPTQQLNVFKAGSTIPVKFKLFMADGVTPVSTAVATIELRKVSNGVPDGTPVDVVSTVPNAGTTFRYDAATQQYIFNLGTKNWTAGNYQITARLDDGSQITVVVGAR